jgi:hypothetical protein
MAPLSIPSVRPAPAEKRWHAACALQRHRITQQRPAMTSVNAVSSTAAASCNSSVPSAAASGFPDPATLLATSSSSSTNPGQSSAPTASDLSSRLRALLTQLQSTTSAPSGQLASAGNAEITGHHHRHPAAQDSGTQQDGTAPGQVPAQAPTQALAADLTRALQRYGAAAG